MILGVTGGIAAGKSLVTEIFRQLGAAVVSADDLAREVVRPPSPVLLQLVSAFGPQILAADGTLDRQTLAAQIFAEPVARLELNRIMHPAIGKLAERRLREAALAHQLVVYEAPLLFEAGAEKRVDAVVVVQVEAAVQVRRLMARDGLSEAEARRRIASQMPQEEKIARADFVIDNSASPETTAMQVRALFAHLFPPGIADGGKTPR